MPLEQRHDKECAGGDGHGIGRELNQSEREEEESAAEEGGRHAVHVGDHLDDLTCGEDRQEEEQGSDDGDELEEGDADVVRKDPQEEGKGVARVYSAELVLGLLLQGRLLARVDGQYHRGGEDDQLGNEDDCEELHSAFGKEAFANPPQQRDGWGRNNGRRRDLLTKLLFRHS